MVKEKRDLRSTQSPSAPPVPLAGRVFDLQLPRQVALDPACSDLSGILSGEKKIKGVRGI